jgi:capsular polysaccharide biosynthesis protein
LKKEIPTLKLLMQYPNQQKNTMYPFVLELLELLSIQSDDIVIVDNNTLYKTVYISTSYTHDFDSNLPPRNEIYELYQHIVNIVRNTYPKIETPSKLYISRRTHLHNDYSNIGTNYTTRRRLINEDEYVDMLVSSGFVEVFTEKLTTIQKIQYFMNAKEVVGAIGGGISNVLFSPYTTRLEAIISPTFLEVNTRFKYSLDCVNTTYNFNTKHHETSEFKLYMRVSCGQIVGEIEDMYNNKLLISYTEDGTNTGWNSQCKYKHIEVFESEVIKIDNGLNSSWEICMN